MYYIIHVLYLGNTVHRVSYKIAPFIGEDLNKD